MTQKIFGVTDSPSFDFLTSKINEVYKTANADSLLTEEECKRTIVSNYGMTDADCAITLPAAAEGLAFICILPAVRARYFRLTANTGDKIYLSGTAGTDAGYIGVASGYAYCLSGEIELRNGFIFTV